MSQLLQKPTLSKKEQHTLKKSLAVPCKLESVFQIFNMEKPKLNQLYMI